jgi:hypothetical protein
MFLHAFQEQVGHSSISRVCIRLFTFTLFTSISLFHYLLFKALLASAFPGAFLFVWIPSPLRIFVVGFFIPFGHVLCLIKWSGKTFYTFFFFSYGSILPFYSIPYPCFLLLCACFVFLDTWGMRCFTRFSFTSWGLFHFSPSSLLSTRYEEILMSELSHKTMAKYSNNLLGALLCKKNSI